MVLLADSDWVITSKKITQNHLAWALILVLLGLGFFLRQPQLSYGIPAVVHPDSFKTVGVAQRLAKEWQSGHLALDPQMYQLPTLYTYLLTLLLTLTNGHFHSEQMGRTLTMGAGLFGVVAVFLMGLRLQGLFVGVLSALILTLGFIFVQLGQYPTPDSLQMTLTLFGVFFLLYKGSLRNQNLILSGLFTGLAMGTKYLGILYVLPLFAVVVYSSSHKNITSLRNRILLWGGSAMLAFILSTPTFLFHGKDFISRFLLEGTIQGTGGLGFPAKRFMSEFFPFFEPSTSVLYEESLAGSMGWGFSVIALGSLIWGFYKGWKNRDPFLFGLALSCGTAYLLLSFVSRISAIRFLLPMVAILVLLVSFAIFEFSNQLVSIFKQRWGHQIQPSYVGILCLTLLLVPSVKKDMAYLKALTIPDNRLVAANWILANIPAQEKIINLMFGPALPSDRYQLVHPSFPEYKYQLTAGVDQGPRFDQLEKNKIQWVVWNSRYTNRFYSDRLTTVEIHYANSWKKYYEDLIAYSHPHKRFKASDGTTPTVEIFHLPYEKPIN